MLEVYVSIGLEFNASTTGLALADQGALPDTCLSATVRQNGRVIARAFGKLATVTRFCLDVADDGPLRHDVER